MTVEQTPFGFASPSIVLLAAWCGAAAAETIYKELPIEQASMFELIINRKAARELGLTLPGSMLARADQVVGN